MVLLGVLVERKDCDCGDIFVAGRLIFSEGNRSFYLGSLLVALATVAGVFAVTSVLQFPGAEYQRDRSRYSSSALNMLKICSPPKGVYLNLLFRRFPDRTVVDRTLALHTAGELYNLLELSGW